MLQAVQGRYHDGNVELDEKPDGIVNARVVVAFLEGDAACYPSVPASAVKGIDALRAWLSTLPDVPLIPLDSVDRERLYP